MNAEIITIGDEILIGQVVDTNSAFLATELNKIGISVSRITSISDNHDEIINILDEATRRTEIVITTGGLGPTSDDITKHTLAEYFNTRLVPYPKVMLHIKTLLSARGVSLNSLNIEQAELPENCELLHNSSGTAQGMWFTKGNANVISLPGVPYEMKGIYMEELEPRLRKRFPLPSIHHITLLTHGLPESQMARVIHDWEVNLPGNLKLAYLPSPGILRLRITGRSPGDRLALINQMEETVKPLEVLIGDQIFGYNDDRLENITGRLLKEKQLTLSLAESCTGGLVSNLITSVPGASDYYKGGIVAYSNDIKSDELMVTSEALSSHGAVSREVVEQMARNIRLKFKTTFSIAVSGIAGPTGGTDTKPVGTTWIAVASDKKISSNVYNFGEERLRNMQKAAIAALFMLRKEIMSY
jgi:nicotinamide-nucleotide amidase